MKKSRYHRSRAFSIKARLLGIQGEWAQPLTQLLRIHQANVSAKEDALVAETQLDQTQDAIALEVRQVYCSRS